MKCGGYDRRCGFGEERADICSGDWFRKEGGKRFIYFVSQNDSSRPVDFQDQRWAFVRF